MGRSGFRIRLVLSILAALMAVLVSGAPTVVAAPDHCTAGDVRAIARAGLQFGSRELGGQPHGVPAASTRKWADCQFRLYDDNDANDPEVAHVFSDTDWFIGAVADLIYYSEFPLVGGDRASAIAYMDTWTTHFFLGPKSVPDADLPEVSLTETSYRDTQFPGFGERVVWKQHYVVFPAGSLSPGVYHYRTKLVVPDGFLAGSFVARGDIVVTTGP